MSLTLVAGSYERFIFGYSLRTLTPNPNSLTLTPLFSYPSHSAPLRSVAISPSASPHLTAASAGADESIQLYNLSTSSSLSSLPFPSGSSPSSLSFFHPLHLLASSDDGHVYIFDWQQFLCLKSIKVSSTGCLDLAVHPSGRVAVVVGRELGLVNLVRGRRSFVCRLEEEVGLVEYVGAKGGSFVMVAGEKVSVHDSEDARMVKELVGEKKVLCIANDAMKGILYTGGEDRGITAWDLSSGSVAYHFKDAHSARIKGLVVFNGRNEETEASNLIASASSDGVIRIWDVRMASKEKPIPLAEANTKSRLTCLAGTCLK